MTTKISPRRRETIEALLQAWAHHHRAQFIWEPDREITYTHSRGAWHLSTLQINGRDDWIDIHPHPDGYLEVQWVADAGHVEVNRVPDEELSRSLHAALPFFQSWTNFFAQGPGRGH